MHSWCTTERFKDHFAESCIFGCRHSRDDQAHCMTCVRLWKAVAARTCPVATNTAGKLALNHADRPLRMKQLAVAFHTYHAIRMDHKQEVQEALATRCFQHLADLAKAAAGVAARSPDIQPNVRDASASVTPARPGPDVIAYCAGCGLEIFECNCLSSEAESVSSGDEHYKDHVISSISRGDRQTDRRTDRQTDRQAGR